MSDQQIVELARRFYLMDVALEAEEAVMLARTRARAAEAKRELFEALRAAIRGPGAESATKERRDPGPAANASESSPSQA